MSKDADVAEQALTEREKMLRGLAYDAMEDPDLVGGRLRARKFLKAYNDYPPPTYDPALPPMQYFGPDERLQILADLFGIPLEKARELAIEPPFWCDYGTNINFKGSAVFMVSSSLDADCAQVTIGTRVMFAPNVNIYAATHSTDVIERRAGLERAYPVTIGDDVWIGGNATLIGPCTIGNGDVLRLYVVSRLVILTRLRIGVTIAAGSVVKGDFPDNVVIGGVPAKILKHLDPPAPLSE
ncbi:trimeric LpxA-like protein [Hysterangium stoloniferum]|nr:trimeric LpxA-like protein [Hysterangium stoloniferum]